MRRFSTGIAAVFLLFVLSVPAASAAEPRQTSHEFPPPIVRIFKQLKKLLFPGVRTLDDLGPPHP